MTHEVNDHRTYKELIQNHAPPYVNINGWLGSLAGWISVGIKFPLLGKWIRRSFRMVCIALSHYRNQGDYMSLYKLLIIVLLSTNFRKARNYRWWYLMRFGIAIAQERQIHWLVRDVVLEDNLILIGSLGPKPWKGYDVAYVFVGYSLWLFERGDIQAALNMIQIAVQADDSWGYPEYLLGWYGLFTRGVDSVSHFAKAVQIDWSFLQRMRQDKTCQQYPDLVREVQKKTLVSK